jgi:hypothetical protein
VASQNLAGPQSVRLTLPGEEEILSPRGLVQIPLPFRTVTIVRSRMKMSRKGVQWNR